MNKWVKSASLIVSLNRPVFFRVMRTTFQSRGASTAAVRAPMLLLLLLLHHRFDCKHCQFSMKAIPWKVW